MSGGCSSQGTTTRPCHTCYGFCYATNAQSLQNVHNWSQSYISLEPKQQAKNVPLGLCILHASVMENIAHYCVSRCGREQPVMDKYGLVSRSLQSPSNLPRMDGALTGRELQPLSVNSNVCTQTDVLRRSENQARQCHVTCSLESAGRGTSTSQFQRRQVFCWKVRKTLGVLIRLCTMSTQRSQNTWHVILGKQIRFLLHTAIPAAFKEVVSVWTEHH